MKRLFFMIPFFCLLFLALTPLRTSALQAEAVIGEPFGVCRIEFPASPVEQKILNMYTDNDASYAAFFESIYQTSLYENNKRALYPVWSMNTDDPDDFQQKTMLFLFHGPDELKVLLSRTGLETLREEIKIEPVEDAVRHKALLEEWWNARLMKLELLHILDLYDPAVESGIASMMGRRLGLPLDNLTALTKYDDDSFNNVFGLLLGTESIRLAMQSNTMLKTKSEKEPADRDLPEAASPPPMPVPDFDDSKIVIEPLAARVPQECFYLRFGSFSVFLDAKDFLDRWGTIFRSTLSSRGVDYDISKRLERQLALRETVLSRYFGSTVVKDVAIIGTDTFLREGATIGILFQASQNALLKKQLESIRNDIMTANSSIQESSVTIKGRTVSLLSSPGNAVRSFYVQDGDFHLVTTSSWMVQAFLATGEVPGQSLGNLEEFHYARSQINPSAKGIFIYLSDPFFRNLVSPAYRVEMTRRAQSAAEIQMLALARLAAMQEGLSSLSVASLIENGFLPQGFGMRSDESHPTLAEDGTMTDSIRGALGSFLPVPDMTTDKITSAEEEAYEHFSAAYRGIWTNMDPVFGLLNTEKKITGERVELRLNISPYAKSRYGNLDRFLGESVPDRVATIPGDLASLEVQLAQKLANELLTDDYEEDEEEDTARVAKKPDLTQKDFSLRLFGGLRDADISWSIQHGSMVRPGRWEKVAMQSLKFYAGLLLPTDLSQKDLQPLLALLGHETELDAKGYAKLNDNLWFRHFGSYYLLGSERLLLAKVSPQIKIEKGGHPSQIALNLGDLSKSSLGNFLRAEAYTRDRRTSAGNALLLHAYQQQLQPHDLQDALKAVQNQNLICPLGGTFVVADEKNQPDRWKSTAWSEETLYYTNKLPKTYHQAILDEMKSLRLEFSIDPDTLKTRLEIQTKAKK